MFTHHILFSVLFWALSILATPLQITAGQTIDMSPATNLTLSTTITTSANASYENAFDIRCDGAAYGFNPSLSDCEGARSYIVPDTEQYEFGERHTGLPESVFPLPYMIIGGMYLLDKVRWGGRLIHLSKKKNQLFIHYSLITLT